jgi:hypothetical protein
MRWCSPGSLDHIEGARSAGTKRTLSQDFFGPVVAPIISEQFTARIFRDGFRWITMLLRKSNLRNAGETFTEKFCGSRWIAVQVVDSSTSSGQFKAIGSHGHTQ